jgi:serine/threonine protein kinase
MAEVSKHEATVLFGGPAAVLQPVPADRPANFDTTPPSSVGTMADPSLPVAPAPPDLTGSLLLDRYRLLRKLGVGGMGTVYEAEHVTIKKRVAIKILNPEFAHRGELVERFLQEARAASMIAHENVVEITDFGATPGGSVFFVMEMLIGEDLSETIKREAPLPWSRAAAITLQICRALQAAHDKGIIHRDMKPENVFRVERHGNADFVKVLDFGIAKLTGEDNGAARLTSTGMIFGTPTYMSPEQAQGMRVDHRADIYAVGVILYELATGKVPFSADNFMGILTKHMFEDPPAPREVAPQAEITPEMEAVILKAMQKERELRFQSLRELSDAILAVGTGNAPVPIAPTVAPRSRPMTGPTQFKRSNSLAPPLEPTIETVAPQPRRGGLAGVLLALAAVAGGSAALVLALRDDDPPPALPAPQDMPVAPVAAPPEPVRTIVPPPPSEPQQPAAPTPVNVTLEANVAAEILDAAGAARLGATGEALALTGAGPHRLLLRADKYEDLAVEIADPKDGQTLQYSLRPRKKGGKATPKPVKEPDGKQPTPPPETKEKPPEGPSGTNFGLKDPFKTKLGP